MTRAILGTVLAVLVAGPATPAPVPDDLDPARLLGKWEPKERKKGEAATSMEFQKGGRVRLVADLGGQPIELKGTYALTGNTLTLTIEFGENDTPNTLKVLKLTDSELELSDPKGVKQTLRRLKAAK